MGRLIVMLAREVVGSVLRAERQAQGLTLRDVAELAGCSLGYISEVERGVKEPSSEVLDQVIGSLGLLHSELFETLAEAAREAGV